MVRKPVHMIKPRVLTHQKSLHDSLDKREQEMSRSGLSTKTVSDSLDDFGKILHKKLSTVEIVDGKHIFFQFTVYVKVDFVHDLVKFVLFKVTLMYMMTNCTCLSVSTDFSS